MSAVSFLERCCEWLLSHEACHRAESIVRQYRLSLEPDDIIQEAIIKLLAADRRHPGRFDDEKYVGANEKAYCTRIMRNLVVDVLRGGSETPLPPEDDRLEDIDEDGLLGDGRQESIEAAERTIDELRAVAESILTDPVILSAVLTLLALQRDPDADVGDVPLPRNGATPEELDMLVALWRAGRHDILDADGRPSTPAQRQARSRLGRRVRTALKRIMDHFLQTGERGERDR